LDSIDHQNVRSFWAWFSQNANKLQPEVISNDVTELLESHIEKLGVSDWEIGPGELKANMFVISPGGDAELFEKTVEIVSLAPSLAEWEFHASKPRRKWKLRFELEDGCIIDGSTWEVAVRPTTDGRYDLAFRPTIPLNLSLKDQEIAAAILTQGEIGEEKVIKRINDIQVVNAWNPNDLPSVRRLKPGLLAKVLD
jgi:hypothetical protein